MNVISAETTFHGTPLESIFKTSKKTIQEYVREIAVIVDTNPFNPK